ncbi:short chain dehydrogenase [Kocuria varians]|uniref:Short chain dehydrogenase n=1 Tax=Kocuria varians TaxID=1272 RepID=A0A4Y4D2W2_KOCVA|nr:SDR family oxidoreductase [Kocuria varians]GEC98074.1 short chain dehydrogenase [Kocuria varians]
MSDQSTQEAAVRTALVTGATRGIGRAVAQDLAKDHVVFIGGRSAEDVERVRAELAGVGPGTRPFVADVSSDEQVAAAWAPLREEFPELNVLVHSAGIAPQSPVADAPREMWEKIFDVNVISVAQLTRLVLPQLRAAGGDVVAVNSGSGFTANPSGALYSGSKFALRALTDALREEERGNGVRVTSVHPGRVATDMQRELHDYMGREYRAEEWIRPEQIAAAVRLAVDATRDAEVEVVTVRPSGMV